MQQATTVFPFLCESRFLSSKGMGVLSLHIVRNWLACLWWFARGTISIDSKVGGLAYWIELSQ